MVSYERALEIAHDWINAWNRRDLDAIMAHYGEAITFRSPLVIERLGIASGTITDKSQLRAYFAKGLESNPNLKFELIELLLGVGSITLYYQRDSGARAAEVVVLDEGEKATDVRVHYTPIVRPSKGTYNP